MVDRRPPTLRVELPLLGKTIDRLIGYRLDADYLTPTDGFSFTVKDPSGELNGLELQPVCLSIDGNPQLVGRIDTGTYRDDGSIEYSGRDYLADLIECHADPTLKLKDEQALTDALLYACGPCGISGVVADEDIGLRSIKTGVSIKGGKAPTDFIADKVKEYKVAPGEGLFEFSNRLAGHHGATIQPGVDRAQLVLSVPNFDQDATYTLSRYRSGTSAPFNNVISAPLVRDLSSLPTYVLASGKEGPTGKIRVPVWTTAAIKNEGKLGGKVDGRWDMVEANPSPAAGIAASVSLTTDQGAIVHKGRVKPGELLSDAAKLYRLFYLRDTDCKSQAQLSRVVRRIIAERIRSSLQYSPTVRGHCDAQTGATYAPNTTIDVVDEIVGVRESLWIAGVSMTYDGGSGARTQLRCWARNSFAL